MESAMRARLDGAGAPGAEHDGFMMRAEESGKDIHLGAENIPPHDETETDEEARLREKLVVHKRKVNAVLFVQFFHSMLSILMTLTFLRPHKDELGRARDVAYRVLTTVTCVNFFFVSSVFYMWSKRTTVLLRARRRLTKGLFLHFLLSDTTMFVIETEIVVNVGFLSVGFALAFAATVISLLYTLNEMMLWVLTRKNHYEWYRRAGGRVGEAAQPPLPSRDGAGIMPTEARDPNVPDFMNGRNDDLYTLYQTPPRTRPAGGIIPENRPLTHAPRLM
eukprot:TRINITY_DN10479_c0_g2_i1.p2 TRINITY_DN10479_c0_g2~~TRINITY_DN10479_c0_g2_i1.p2  ORF type:complete len:277 (+),score=81.20 TRINITY_DN10479_c0_g2_i1:68-898(+)